MAQRESAHIHPTPCFLSRLSSARKVLNSWADNAVEEGITKLFNIRDISKVHMFRICKIRVFEVIHQIYIGRARVSITRQCKS